MVYPIIKKISIAILYNPIYVTKVLLNDNNWYLTAFFLILGINPRTLSFFDTGHSVYTIDFLYFYVILLFLTAVVSLINKISIWIFLCSDTP